MTMGERIRLARAEAGLSQRELAGEEMTRNMLSLLEHDEASPSLASLRYLSQRLEKPMSYLLGEDTEKDAENSAMTQAWDAWENGRFRVCLDLLGQTEGTEREKKILELSALLALVEKMTEEQRIPYSRTLLCRAEHLTEETPWLNKIWGEKLQVLLTAAAEPEELPGLAQKLPSQDLCLSLKGKAAILEGRYADAMRYFDGMEERNTPQWHYDRGELFYAQGQYNRAAEEYHQAEQTMPEECRQRLEICYRELEDYKMAYYYAKKS